MAIPTREEAFELLKKYTKEMGDLITETIMGMRTVAETIGLKGTL